MIEFKTWAVKDEFGNGWLVMRSSTQNDERPFRLLGRFETEDQAKTYLMQLWGMK